MQGLGVASSLTLLQHQYPASRMTLQVKDEEQSTISKITKAIYQKVHKGQPGIPFNPNDNDEEVAPKTSGGAIDGNHILE